MFDVDGSQRMETVYMALADKTRLRLLNLMRDEEVCVGFFTEVLGESQPKISRHLAYLRAAGLVNARRDGKWMHYSIKHSSGPVRAVIDASLSWMETNEEMTLDRTKYDEIRNSSSRAINIKGAPDNFIYAQPDITLSSSNSGASAHNELEEFLL